MGYSLSALTGRATLGRPQPDRVEASPRPGAAGFEALAAGCGQAFLTVGGIVIVTWAFRIGERKPAGTCGGVQLRPFEGLKPAAGPHGEGFERANF